MISKLRIMESNELGEFCKEFLDDHRVVFEEKVVQVFGNKRRQTRIRHC